MGFRFLYVREKKSLKLERRKYFDICEKKIKVEEVIRYESMWIFFRNIFYYLDMLVKIMKLFRNSCVL